MTTSGTRSEPPDFLVPDSRPACAGVDQAVFFPKYETAVVAKSVERAYCRRCPVRAGCREWALRQQPDTLFGIWAGMSQRQRRRLHRKGQR